ncbi:transcriptional regulator [Leptospira sp. WS92.C1]
MERKDLQEEFEELMTLYLFGELPEDDNQRLNHIIEQNFELKKRYDNYLKMQGGLKLHSKSLTEIISNTTPRETSKRKTLINNPIYRFLAIAAILVFAFSVYWISKNKISQTNEELSFETIGQCDLNQLKTGVLRSDQKSFCDVRIVGKTGVIHFRIFSESEVNILHLPKTEKESLSLFLVRGKLLLNESIQSSNKTTLYINGTQIRLLGTKVLLENSERGSSVKVWDGSVNVQSGIRYLLPFLSEKKSVESLFPNLNPEEIDLFKDVFSETISDSQIEIHSELVSKELEMMKLALLNETGNDPQKIFIELKEIKERVIANSSVRKKIKLNSTSLDRLQSLSDRLGTSESIEAETRIDSPGNGEKKTPEWKENGSDLKNKSSPVRLGIKTVKLKDGSELKGNLIQYENRYILETNGKKRAIMAKEVESISF